MDIFSRSTRAQTFRIAQASPPDLLGEVARLDEIFANAKAPFLLGDWCIADAFYAPVVTRFITYEVATSPKAKQYMNAVMARASTQAWVEKARTETAVLEY